MFIDALKKVDTNGSSQEILLPFNGLLGPYRNKSFAWRHLVSKFLSGASAQEIIEVAPMIRIILNKLYTSVSTKQAAYKMWRDVLQHRFGKESEIYKNLRRSGLYSISSDEFKELGENAEMAKIYKNEHQLKINFSDLFKALMSGITLPNRESDQLLAQILMVMLLTGRRMIEVLKLSTFSMSKIGTNLLLVKDLAKQTVGPRIQLNIPILGEEEGLKQPSKYVLNLISEIREKVPIQDYRGKKLTNVRIGELFNKKLNTYLSGVGKQIGGLHLTTHKLRAIYAAEAYHLFAPDGVSVNAFYKDVLGHQNINTSINYNSIDLV